MTENRKRDVGHQALTLAMTLTMSLAALQVAHGETYHIDSISGDDGNDGTKPSAPWQTLEKVNSMLFRPGDTILFRCGTVYQGQLRPRGSGLVDRPISIRSYGTGNRPRIDAQGEHQDSMLLKNIEYWEVSGLELTNLGPSRKPGRTGLRIVADGCGTLHHIHI